MSKRFREKELQSLLGTRLHAQPVFSSFMSPSLHTFAMNPHDHTFEPRALLELNEQNNLGFVLGPLLSNTCYMLF